jgi:hypothetical protein
MRMLLSTTGLIGPGFHRYRQDFIGTRAQQPQAYSKSIFHFLIARAGSVHASARAGNQADEDELGHHR